MTTVRSLLAEFGISYDDKGGLQVENRLEGLKQQTLALGPMITAALSAFGLTAGVAGIKRLLDDTSQLGANVDDVSQKLGVATDELQELRYAAEMSGGSAELMDGSLTKLSRTMAEAAAGGKEQAQAFRDIGVSVKDASGETRPAGDVMGDVADAIATMEDPAKRVNAAMKIFGRSGAELIPMLREGGEGLRALREEAHEVGAVMSKELIESSRDYDDTLHRWKMTLRGVRNTIAMQVMPVATSFYKWMIDAVKETRAFLKDTKILQAGLGVMGTLLAGAGLRWLLMSGAIGKVSAALRVVLPLLGRLLWPIALVTTLAAIVDDLHALFTGGRSFIGAWLDELFGIGTAQVVVESFREGWELLDQAIDASIDTVQAWAQAAAQWLGGAWDYVQEAGDEFLLWMKDVFGVAFIDDLKYVGEQIVDYLVTPFKEAADYLEDILGFDGSDLKKAFSSESVVAQRRIRVARNATDAGVATNDQMAKFVERQKGRHLLAPRQAAVAVALPARARLPAGAGGRGGSRSVNLRRGPTTFQVSGAQNPRATAREIADALAEQDERDREDAFEALDRTEDD